MIAHRLSISLEKLTLTTGKNIKVNCWYVLNENFNHIIKYYTTSGIIFIQIKEKCLFND